MANLDEAWIPPARDLPASSVPMLGGLGREPRIRQALEALPAAERSELVAVLDEVSRPMTARELDEALMITGLSRSDRKRLTLALKDFSVLMVAER